MPLRIHYFAKHVIIVSDDMIGFNLIAKSQFLSTYLTGSLLENVCISFKT